MAEPSQERSQQREVVGAEHSGKWIAWNAEGLAIIASEDSYQAAAATCEAKGIHQPIFEYVPPTDAGFVGGL